MPVSLVTGGAGFIGRHVSHELLSLGHEVIILDDLSGGFEENLRGDMKFIRGSITDPDLIDTVFNEHKINFVYHLAAYAAEGLSHFIRRFNYTNNLIGSVNLINAAIKHKVKCFVFTSSIAVYGSVKPPMSEDISPSPEDPYGIAKYAVEMDLKSAHDMFGLNYIVFRPHNVYGKYQNLGDKYRNVIGIFMNQLMQGKQLTIFGDGNQTRAFSDIIDVAPHIAKSVNIPEAYNQIFNIGGDREYSVNYLANAVMKAMDLEGPVKHLDARNEVIHAYSDHSKAQRVFDISDFTTLEIGLGNMAKWAKSTGIRSSPTFRDIEITENLPPTWLVD